MDINEIVKKIKVLNEFVLIKQKMTKKQTKIIINSNDDKDKFDIEFEVLQVSPACKNGIQVGDIPVFSEYVRFNLVRMLEKSENGMLTLLAVHENDIIAIDNSEPEVKIEPDKN